MNTIFMLKINSLKIGYFLRASLPVAFSKSNGLVYCFNHGYRDNEEFQYLHKSLVPTDYFQDSLPRLPIPDINNSCRRYLDSLQPIIDPYRLQRTTRIVEEFRTGQGRELNEELKALDEKNKHTSYVAGPWMNWHLTQRDLVFLTSNAGVMFKDDPDPKFNTQLLRATNMIVSFLRFLRSLKANVLEPDISHQNRQKSDTTFFKQTMRLVPRMFACSAANRFFQAKPIDMSQYAAMFSSTRIPLKDRDELQTHTATRHVVVLSRDHFYTFDVLDEQGFIIPPSDILGLLSYILKDTPPTPPVHPVSVLTTEHRDTWAMARQRLLDQGNAEQLNTIESAILHLALDDADYEDNLHKTAHYTLHGPNNNRWYDKSFILIVSNDGKATFNFEHSWADGRTVVRLMTDIYRDSTQNHFVHPETRTPDMQHRVKKLDFILDDSLKHSIQTAKEKHKEISDKVRLKFLHHHGFCRNTIRQYKISPNFVAELGIQMAFYKLYGKFAATYEANSTATFKHGRLEVARPLTSPMKRCVVELHKSNPVQSQSELYRLLRAGSEAHKQIIKESAVGQSFHCHFLALQSLVEAKNSKMPDIFLDPVFAEANHFIICNSSVSSAAIKGVTFSPVVDDGFGTYYGFLDNHLVCNVCSYDPQRDVSAFTEAMHHSYDEVLNVLSKSHADK